MALLAQDLVLGKEHAVDAAHQATSLAIEVTENLLLERRLVEVATADGDAQRNRLLLRLAGHVLVDGNGGVDTPSLTEEGPHGTAATFRGNEDDVDVGRNVDAGLRFEDRGEAVGEIEGL